jgi:ATP-binding cassette subfamily F protein 3
LEESLQSFDGTILAVSHDRYFINKLATRVLEIQGSSLMDYRGDYSYYLECRNRFKKEQQSQQTEENISSSKMERLQNKEERTRQRKLEKQLAETEQEIGMIEARLQEIESEMLLEEVMTDHIKLTQLHEEQTRLSKRLEELYPLWDSLDSQK